MVDPVSLPKVTLTKSAPTISLAKSGQSQGVMRVNLNWSQPQGKKGLFSRGPAAVDLDLGCLYELADGSKGVVQALGNRFGSLTGTPHIALDGDDRSGQSAGGENMHIDLTNPGAFRRILIFAMIYEGAPNWAAADGVVTMFPTSGRPVEVVLDAAIDGAPMCAIALLSNEGGEITVTRQVQYIKGWHPELDKAYNWGLTWTVGTK